MLLTKTSRFSFFWFLFLNTMANIIHNNINFVVNFIVISNFLFVAVCICYVFIHSFHEIRFMNMKTFIWQFSLVTLQCMRKHVHFQHDVFPCSGVYTSNMHISFVNVKAVSNTYYRFTVFNWSPIIDMNYIHVLVFRMNLLLISVW